MPGRAEKTLAEEGKFGLGLCFSGGGKREGLVSRRNSPYRVWENRKGLLGVFEEAASFRVA